MQSSKIKLTQKDFDSIYEIEDKIEEITGETEDSPTPEPEIPVKQDTTPDKYSIQLTEEEQQYDEQLHQDLPQEEQQ